MSVSPLEQRRRREAREGNPVLAIVDADRAAWLPTPIRLRDVARSYSERRVHRNRLSGVPRRRWTMRVPLHLHDPAAPPALALPITALILADYLATAKRGSGGARCA